METIKILDVPIHTLTRDQALDHFFTLANNALPSVCTTPNAEILLQAQKDQDLQDILKSSSLNCADSVSLLWAGAVLGNNWNNLRAFIELLFLPIRKKAWKKTFPQTVTGSDLYLSICEKAAKQRKSVFLLGGQGAVPEANKTNLQTRFPTLEIAGWAEGSPNNKFDQLLVHKINQSEADILFIAFGCPQQERWLKRNLSQLKTVKVGIGIGGSFDFVAGYIPRAPRLMRRMGFEWFWRLLRQPSRWKRIFNAVVIFPYQFLKWRNSL